MKKNKAAITIIIICAVNLFIAGLFSMPALALTADNETSDILEMLTEELNLTQDQVQKLSPELDHFATTVNQLKKDNEKDDSDPKVLIRGIKKGREEYLEAVKKIFTPEQFSRYEGIQKETMKGMCTDLAEIQLLDLQPRIGFTDEQFEKLTPVFSDNLFQVIQVASENSGKRLRPGQKLSILKKLKYNQKEAYDKISNILTPEQLKKWKEIKENSRQ